MKSTLRLILFSASLALAHAAAPSACAESVSDASLNTPEGNTSVAIEAPTGGAKTQTPKPNAPVGPPPDPGKHPTDQTNVGDPVGVVSGAASSSAVDVVVRCPGIDLVFQRVYNGSLATSSALGHRWTHSYDWRLVPYASGDWMVLTAMADPARSGGCSSLHYFERFEDGTYSMSDADQYVLVKNPDGTYRVRTPGGRAYLFGADGVLDAIEHISGARVSLTYENRSGPGARRLTRVEHVNGKALEFAYGDGGTLSSIEVPGTGLRVDYAYTNVVVQWSGLAESVSELMESDWALRYDDWTPRDYLAAHFDDLPYRSAPALASATRTFAGQTSTMTYAYERCRVAERSIIKDVLRKFLANGGGVAYGASKGGPSTDGTTVGHVEETEVVDKLVTTTFFLPEYDSYLSRKTDANGISASFDYARFGDSGAPRVIRTVMDGGLYETDLDYRSGQTEVIRPVAGVPVKTTIAYDPETKRETQSTTGAQVVESAYGSRGDLSQLVVRDTATAAWMRTDIVSGTWHNPTNVGSGYCRAPANFWSIDWSEAWLTPRRIASPEGRVGEWTLDGWNLTVHGAGTNSPLDTVLYNCDTNWRVNAIVNANQHTTTLHYDALGYLLRLASPGQPDAAFAYDPLGHLEKVSEPGPDGSIRETLLENNAFGRPTRVVHPDGSVESFKYDGNWRRVVESVDPLGRTNTYDWVLGVPVLAKRFTASRPAGVPLFAIAHDQQMNTLSISDPLGRRAESYVLDANERVVAVTNLEGQAMTREFLVGGVVGRIGRYDGSQVSFDYSGDGDLRTVAYPDGAIAFTYDRDGLLLSASGAAGTVANEYNEAAWLTKTRGVDGAEVSYAYHPAGQVSNVVTVAGATGYALDAADRLSRIAAPSAAFDYAYNPWNGFVSAVTNDVGLVAEFQYDIMDRPTNIVWRKAGGGVVAAFDYEYNAVGMITDHARTVGAASTAIAYGYDDLDRLVSETESSGASRTYGYDLAGNRLSKTQTGAGTVTYALGVGDRLATYTGGAYSHNAAGCVTSIDRTGNPDLALTWNGQYQLTSVSTNGVVAESYAYDPLGRRASTTAGGVTVRHVYDGAHCAADIDSSGALLRSYTWGPGIDNLLAVTCHSGSSATTYYALTDIQGTVHGFADAGGNLVARYEYDAWGNLLDVDVAVSELANNRYLFQGREYSWATGLYNFRLRWYDPATGRWLSKDPIGISGGLNLYAFCGNDPVNYVDPMGLREEGSKWDQMEWWEKLGEGYYYGTGFGEDALQYYVDITLDPNAPWYQKGPAYIGGCLAALWTPETYQETAWTLISAYGMRKAGTPTNRSPTYTTKDIERVSPGRDGGQSIQRIRYENGTPISRQHIVTREGKVIHTHIEHISTSGTGTVREFPSEWTGIP